MGIKKDVEYASRLGAKVITRLSYPHIEQLLKISIPLKRTFYELECIKGWSARELKRQIASQYFGRSGLSKHPKKLTEQVLQNHNLKHQKTISKISIHLSFWNWE